MRTGGQRSQQPPRSGRRLAFAMTSRGCDAGGVSLPVVLAHQANWDEMLIVLIPIALFWGLLRVGRRRADAIHEGRLDPAELGIDDSSFGPKINQLSESMGPGPSPGGDRAPGREETAGGD